jgi:hypothetical protein
LPSSSKARVEATVTLPPGLARLATKPISSGLLEIVQTIGTSCVSLLAISVGGWKWANGTSGLLASNSTITGSQRLASPLA